MQSINRKMYVKASDGIKEYMLSEYDALQGEFITLIWQSFSMYRNNNEKRVYWERLIQEIFIILRLLS